MTDHKFTDDDVIKALECCSKDVPILNSCEGCPFAGKKCAAFLPQTALDLINRQKAEIEKLKGSRNRWKQIATDFDKASRETEKEIERLYKEIERISKMTVETNVKVMTEENK